MKLGIRFKWTDVGECSESSPATTFSIRSDGEKGASYYRCLSVTGINNSGNKLRMSVSALPFAGSRDEERPRAPRVPILRKDSYRKYCRLSHALDC